MSINNLYKSGIKDQDIIVDNLVVNETATINNLVLEDTTITGNLTLTGNLISDGQVISDRSSLVGSLSEITIQQGVHNITSGQSNPLIISNLDANSDNFYKMYLSFNANPTNSSNFLTLTLNNDSTGYASRVITENNSNLTANISVVNMPNNGSESNYFHLVRVNTALQFAGCGEFLFWLNKVNVNVNPYGKGHFSAYRPESGSVIQNFHSAFAQLRPNGTEITSITIDVSDTNHTGWGIFYKITRMI
jgi:hypothetical protein